MGQLVEIDFDRQAHETHNAYAFYRGERDEDDKEIWLWVPKTIIDSDYDPEDGSFQVPVWWASKEGLI